MGETGETAGKDAEELSVRVLVLVVQGGRLELLEASSERPCWKSVRRRMGKGITGLCTSRTTCRIAGNTLPERTVET